MMKRFLTLAIALLVSSGALAQQIDPGTMMGNSRATAGPPRQETVTALLDRALTAVNGRLLCRTGGAWDDCLAPVLGIPGTATGTIAFAGVTSGTVTITPQGTAGSPTLTLPNASGTFAVGATSPLALSATTGMLTCTTCLTSGTLVTTAQGGTGANTTATANRYLKGNGSVWQTSTGSASGVGACGGGQFVTTLNSDAAPTCATPAGGGDVTAAANFGTDNRAIRSDGTTKGVQASGVTIDDSDNVSGVNSIAGNVVATAAQQETATSAINVVTPSVQQRHPSAAKAWGQVSVSGSVASLVAGYNVSSVAWGATGLYSVTLTTGFTTTSAGACIGSTVSGSVIAAVNISTTTGLAVSTRLGNTGADIDQSFYFVCFGDQ